MSEQLLALQKKLSTAISQRKDLEATRQTELESLAQFVAKLSLACKGIDIELDNKLANFRRAQAKGSDFQILRPLIDDISLRLAKHEALQNAQMRQLQTSVTDAGKKLQKTKGMAPEIRRNLRTLLNDQLEDVQATFDYIPILRQLVDIYSDVLAAKENVVSGAVPQVDDALALELINLTSEISFDSGASAEIEVIKEKIKQSNSVDSLLQCCVAVIRVVVGSFTKERQSAQHFLASLNQTLAQLHNSIVATSDKNKQLDTRTRELYQQIEGNIQTLSRQASEADSISALKEAVDDTLKNLTRDLNEKEQMEADERKSMEEALSHMQNRVSELENTVTEYNQRLAEQRFISLRDGLTKLPNRIAFEERLELEIKHFASQAQPICLAVLDVDHFKNINDSYGHSAGDKTLQVIASALKKTIRSSDFIARFGGEEFTILMPSADLQQVVKPLEKLRQAIKSIPFKFKNKQVQITVSIGVTQFKHGDSPLSAFDRADAALYEAKNSGRDRLVVKN